MDEPSKPQENYMPIPEPNTPLMEPQNPPTSSTNRELWRTSTENSISSTTTTIWNAGGKCCTYGWNA